MSDKLDITRRDFLNGVALSLAAGTTLSPLELLASTASPSMHYPPLLTGLRGSHVGSWEVAHSVAMAGARYGYPKEQTDSTYDLVVVGGGISGLAAAHFFQKEADKGKRVLVIDNHDDFGGHAKRNEFEVDGEHLIGYGGSQSMESPGQYSRMAKGLLADLGIEPSRFYDYYDRGFNKGHALEPAIYFSKEAYGKDKTLRNAMGGPLRGAEPQLARQIIAGYPLSAESKASLRDLLVDEKDHLAGMSRDEKSALLVQISYSEYLREHVGVTEEVVTLMRDTIRGYWGIGWDALSALEAYRMEQPATAHLGLDEGKSALWSDDEPYIFHFPDGNAGIARALVRSLLPEAVPGSTMEDLVTSRVDYSLLDHPSNGTRIRLSTTAVNVRHTPDQAAVDVVYIRNGKPERVRAHHVVLACFNRIIPHILPELPDKQRQAIKYAEKTPLVYVNIAVRNWQAFANLGTYSVYVPQPELMHSFGLDFPVSIGDYRYTSTPDQPTVLHGTFIPTFPDQGLNRKEQARLGQHKLLEMNFDDFEAATLRQLEGALGSAGFDAGRDIAAITINRWPHGYAYEYDELQDPPEYSREYGPHVVGRARIGRVSIANSDSEAYAYVDGAIDAALRAVKEQINL
jgi:spermidine dehydrogenase